MSKKKPGLISATLEADYRGRFREIIAKKIKAIESPTVRKSESISTLDGGTMWLSGSSVTSAKPFTSTSTGSGWSGSSIYTPFTSSISSFGSASWVFDPDVFLTEDERQMVTEVICAQLVEFGPGVPKTYSWVSSSGPVSGTFTSAGTFSYDET